MSPAPAAKERLALNAVSGAGFLALTIAISFVLTPITVGALGDRDYGLWELLLVLVGTMSLLDLGVGPALVRTFAFEAAREDEEATLRVFATALFALAGVGILALLGFLFFASVPSLIVGADDGSDSRLPLAMTLVGLGLAIKLPATVFTAYLQGVQRHWLLYVVRGSMSCVQAVLVFIALTRWDGDKLSWLAWITLGTIVVETAIFAGLHARSTPGLRPRLRKVSRAEARRLYRFGAKTVLGLVSDRLRVQAMPLVIAQVIGVERVVFYLLAQRLATYATQFGTLLARPLQSHWSDLYGRDDRQKMQVDWIVTSRLLQFFYCGLAVGIAVLGGPFVGQWIGPEYGEQCRSLVAITSLALFFEGLAPNALGVLTGMDRHGRAGAVLLAAALLAVGAAALFGHRYDLEGVAAAYAGSAALSTIGVMTLGCRAIGIAPLQHLRNTLLPLALPLAAELLTLLALERANGTPSSFAQIGVHAALAGGVYVGLWAAWTLSSDERALLRGLVAGALRRGRPRGGPGNTPA